MTTRGKVYYGMHFYPGIAEYNEGGKAFRVFLKEDVIRKMGPSFSGCPVFVEHVDEVNPNKEDLKSEADGWVVNSFFNESDGKHWVKFVVVSDRGEDAIKNGFQLSNCYEVSGYGEGGTWNGMDYDREVTDAFFDHLALVRSPRYKESIVLNTEQFKDYNEGKRDQLKKLSNDKKGYLSMLKFFKKAKVENSEDFKNVSVQLPNSKKELTIEKMVSKLDEMIVDSEKPRIVNSSDLVKVDGKEVSVKILLERLENAKKKKNEPDYEEDADEEGDDFKDNEDDEDDDKKDNEDDDKKDNEDDEDDDKKENEDEYDEMENEVEEKFEELKNLMIKVKKNKKNNKKKNKKKNSSSDEDKEAKSKARRLRNADKETSEEVNVSIMSNGIARGKQLYGS